MAEETQVLVKFVTKLPISLRVPETPVAVPSTLRRYGLSQIINHLLALDPPRPFDFLVNGELVRCSLEAHLLGHNLSAESTLQLEYVPAVVPPRHKHSTPHDDWVSSVDGSRGADASGEAAGSILSGSCDGLLRLWDADLHCTSSAQAHDGGVSCVRFLPKSQGDLLLTAGKDRTVKMWKLDDSASSGRCRLLAAYRGHSDGVECVAPSPSGRRFASCGWDGRLMVWETGRAVAEAAEVAAEGGEADAGVECSKKKRKVAAATTNDHAAPAANGNDGGGSCLSISECSTELNGHLHCVSAVCWAAEEALFSSGWDHSVRRWDVEAGVAADTHSGSKTVLALASHAACPQLLAFGCTDCALRIWDSRARAGGGGGGADAVAVTTQGSHGGWVTGVAWCPSSQHHLATSSHDGSLKLWDLRARVSLASLSHHTGKVLCVGWLGGGGGGLVSGGADCQLRLYEGGAGL
ncbi:Ribosome biogenesis protein WDR12 [Tetrabaena socialis]|uniref:Ribosome biogenesis protein WDR12 homolog n=1 Tax=Tetrabaena socialis TaxID=47790 RepID=A0A2J7ZLP8_9CHLO|nr:Ribosome biogenesis protein WDR12 [Tetrabaena socialis]|eukprot:PNH01193.1 Ribosome biogenesis protein WDR12 [Tetrabaena socialis]